ncbi:retropepsin-like aspartic protease [Hyphobacterium sp.]|uniref:retropepsin-like aspartic protease n=1 Tax=Hyphobacterium sp. TaxID=2004662 RepID=UPI003BAD0729
MFVTALMALAIISPSPTDTPHTASMDISTGRPVVEVMINGEGPFPFIFDTGASGAMIRTSLVETLSLELGERRPVGSPAGGDPVEVDTTQLSEIQLGGAQANDIGAIIIDFGDPTQMGSVGVIGPDIFADYGRVAYDFLLNRVEIGGELRHATDATWLSFAPTSPLIEIPLRVEDVSLPVHIDTGNPSTLTFPETRINELPITAPARVVGEARTIDRVMEIQMAPIDASAFIGDAEIPLSRITTLPLPFANMGTAALIGLYLEIDWRTHRVAISDGGEN